MSLDVQRIDRETGRAAVVARLRALLPVLERRVSAGVLPFGLPEIDRQLPAGGLAFDALHESRGATPTSRPPWHPAALLGRAAASDGPETPALLCSRAAASAPSARPTATACGGSGSIPRAFSSRKRARKRRRLWAMQEALRSAAPRGRRRRARQAGSQDEPAAASCCGRAGVPLFLLRPARAADASAAATRWRVAAARAARDRFGLFARWRWRLALERCRNGRPGEWLSGVGSCRASFRSGCRAGRSCAFSQAQSRGTPLRRLIPAPFVLPTRRPGGPRIAALNEAARSGRASRSAMVSPTRAPRPAALQMRDADRDGGCRGAAPARAVGDALYARRSRLWDEENGGDGLFLDITGAAHLFGGEAKLLR